MDRNRRLTFPAAGLRPGSIERQTGVMMEEYMKTLFVSRHPGAVEWAARHGFSDVEVVPHLDIPNDPIRVIGTLPVNLAAQVCAAGGEYHHLSMVVPPEWRGCELTADQMDAAGAQVERMLVMTVETFDEIAGRAMAAFDADGLAYGHNLQQYFGI